MFTGMVAVLDAWVPALFNPTAVTVAPTVGFTWTVMEVLSGMLEHWTTTGMGFVCWPGMMTAGFNKVPVEFAGTAIPAMLEIANCVCCAGAGMMIG
jgi:hypothetical protein